jgi:Flp pilus assembly protein TadB
MDLSPAALATVVLAGTAAALSVSNPAGQVARAGGSSDIGSAEPSRPLPRLLAGRTDAGPLRTRLVVSAGAALGAGLLVRQLGGVFETVGWILVPLLAAASVVTLGQLEPGRSRQRAARLVFDLPQALELLSACLAAGMPLRQATRAVADAFDGPVAEDLGSVLRQVDLGISDAEAWGSMRSQPQWSAAAVDLARSVESGTMMVEVLVHHAKAARQLRQAALEVRAKAVGVRSVLPLMTCFLPAFMLLGIVPTVVSAVQAALF